MGAASIRIAKLRDLCLTFEVKFFDKEVLDQVRGRVRVVRAVDGYQTKQEDELMEEEARFSFHRLARRLFW